MGLKEDMKKEILLDSFEVLKENIYNNSSELQEIVLKLSVIDFDLAIEVWRYLLREFKHIGEYGNETYYLTSDLVWRLKKSIGIELLAKLMVEDEFIRNVIYKKAASPDKEVLAYFIDSDNLLEANLILSYVFDNQNHVNPRESDVFGEYLYYTIKVSCKNIREEGVNFLLEWADKVTHEYKAKIKLALLEYM